MEHNKLPDNLLSRATRIYVDAREFVNSDGEKVHYKRLCIDFTIGGNAYTYEASVDRKDLQLLSVTDKRPVETEV